MKHYIVMLYNYPSAVFVDKDAAVKFCEDFLTKNGSGSLCVKEYEDSVDYSNVYNIVWSSW